MHPRLVAFILSADYSGSTWVGYTLGSHSQSAFLGEFYRGWKPWLRQQCGTCTARGLRECKVLQGFEKVGQGEAYGWAFERTQKRVIVDSSKTLDWPSASTRSMKNPDFRVIHLLRDPRGWISSQIRRNPELDVPAALDLWLSKNERIRSFAESTGSPYVSMFYEDIGRNPKPSFRALFAFLGLGFEAAALDYWNFEHHGFAANGSTSMVFDQRPEQIRVTHFRTADDRFYTEHRRQQFVDERWKTELKADTLNRIARHEAVRLELELYGRCLLDDGLAHLAST